jgi:hypothetical protein
LILFFPEKEDVRFDASTSSAPLAIAQQFSQDPKNYYQPTGVGLIGSFLEDDFLSCICDVVTNYAERVFFDGACGAIIPTMKNFN